MGGFNGDVRMISGCRDEQQSADVSNVSSYGLPDPAGLSGGACTSTLLNILYANHHKKDLTFVQVLTQMRRDLKKKKYTQVPQLTSSKPLDINLPFHIVPDDHADGTRRAVLIGINYVGHGQGELTGCHNDVYHVMDYIMDAHGFEAHNITILLDDGKHTQPTYQNILNAYDKIVRDSRPGDSIFCHYSGHGGRVRDRNGDEEDGYDETLIPVDYQHSGQIVDDDLSKTLILPLKKNVTLTCFMDCCHSGTVLDLPYKFVADGTHDKMELDATFDFGKYFNNERFNFGRLLKTYGQDLLGSILIGHVMLETWRMCVSAYLFFRNEFQQ